MNWASTREKLSVLPREVCTVLKDQLTAKQFAVIGVQKSAEGIVGHARVTEGPI